MVEKQDEKVLLEVQKAVVGKENSNMYAGKVSPVPTRKWCGISADIPQRLQKGGRRKNIWNYYIPEL